METKIKEIHGSLVNGQRRQMVKQINQYGIIDFFPEYKAFLLDLYCEHSAYGYFSDAVISYHKLSNR